LRILITFIWVIAFNSAFAQGSFPGAVGVVGNKAIFKDSSIIKSWASTCVGNRGFIDISNKGLGYVNNGKTDYAIGKSDPKVFSLGDSGRATLSYNGILFDGPGPDFCVFENSFNNEFLELAFVEVSSDGVHFFRFPSDSETDTTTQIGSFDLLDASEINNLAGKYKGQYGTPFDLQELKNTPGLSLDSITHIRLVDVIGSIDTVHASRDSKGRIINDPYPTDFKNGDWYTGGFDIESVGLINYTGEIFLSDFAVTLENQNLTVYPIPAQNQLFVDGLLKGAALRIISLSGTEVELTPISDNEFDVSDLDAGIYFLEVSSSDYITRKKFIKL